MDKSLILFFRDDLASLREPDQAVRQAGIATISFMKLLSGGMLSDHDNQTEAHLWANAVVDGTDDRGTLAMSIQSVSMGTLALNFKAEHIPHGVIRDPKYTVRDGRGSHVLDVQTGVWAFMTAERARNTHGVISFPSYTKVR